MSKKKKQKIAASKTEIPIQKSNANSKLIFLLGLIISLIAFIQYAQTISYDFALDDYSAILENHVTKNGIDAIPTIFKTTYRFGYPIQGDELYRPVPKSIFAIIYTVAGENPMPYHFLNVLLYALTGFFLFTLLCKLLPLQIYVAFGATALFIAHPIHTEVVANIKSVDEILSFLFFVFSLHTLLSYLESGKKSALITTLILFFAALLSKESSITYLAVYPLCIYIFTKTADQKIVSTTLLLSIPVLLFLLIRSRVVGETVYPSMADNALFSTPDFLERKATAVYILGLYLKLLIFPYQLTFDYSLRQIPIVGVGSWQFILPAVIFVSLLVYAITSFKKKSMIAFGILFFLITISISSNIFIYIGTHMAERLLFVPSFGFCFAVAFLLDYFLKGKTETVADSLQKFFFTRTAFTATLFVIVFLYSAKAISQNNIWRNNFTLYESGVVASPLSHRTHYYLGNYLLKKEYLATLSGQEKTKAVSRAFSELRKSVSIYPGMSDAWLQIGNYFSNTEQKDSAIFYLKKAIQVQPSLATAHNNLGAVYFGMNDLNKAVEELRLAIKYNPTYHDAYKNMGSVIATAGKFDEAIPYFRKAIELDPSDAETNYYIAITYESMGNTKMKKHYMDIAASIDPKYK